MVAVCGLLFDTEAEGPGGSPGYWTASRAAHSYRRCLRKYGLPGSQAGFSWRPGDRSTTRTRVTVEKVLNHRPVECHRATGTCGTYSRSAYGRTFRWTRTSQSRCPAPRPNPNTRCASLCRCPPLNRSEVRHGPAQGGGRVVWWCWPLRPPPRLTHEVRAPAGPEPLAWPHV